jgi:hypothetical protein
VSGRGKNITMKRHVYDYLTSNSGRLRNQNANLSEFWSLVSDDFNALTDEFVDASENITINQVDDDLQERLRAKARGQTTRNYYSEHNVQYSDKFNLVLATMRNKLTTASVNSEQNNRCKSADRRCEIIQQITILEEDKKVLQDSIRTETFLAHPDNRVAL